MSRRDPYILAPFGNASRIGGPDGVLSFREGREPETTLSIGFRSLEMAAFGVLQSYAGVSDGFAFGVQDLAADSAESCGRKRAKASDS